MSIATPKFSNRKVSPGIALSPASSEGTFRLRKFSSIITPEFPQDYPNQSSPSPTLSFAPSSFENASLLSQQSHRGSITGIKKVETLPPWPNNKDGYELKDVIGIGATAVVHEAQCLPRNERCAVKRINLDKLNTSIDELLKEIHAMCSCHHENVVTYHTSFVVKEELWLILRLQEGGSLLDIIKRKRKIMDCARGVLDEQCIATILKEVLKGLEYFHSNGQIHRDIKAGNILLGGDGSVQIADFGVASWLATHGDHSRQKVCHTFVGTPCWMAPEVMEQNHGYDFKADIWSLGITAIEMVTGRAPYHKYPPMKILMLTLQNDPPTIETDLEEKDKDRYKHYSKSFRKMIADCLQKDPTKRPTATELLKHSFFKNNARDKKFLFTTLVRPIAEAPVKTNAQSRSRKESAIRRRKVSHLNPQGEWVWSSEDDSGNDEDFDGSSTTTENPGTPTPTTPDPDHHTNTIQQGLTLTQGSQQVPLSPVIEVKPIQVVLRVRNAKRELNDIRFEFLQGTDTEEGIASELVAAGLISPKDKDSIVINLTQLIRNRETVKTVNFLLGSKVPAEYNNNLPPKRLSELDATTIGFANMIITDPN